MSSWLEPLTFAKQLQTANICLNVERCCISEILRATVGGLKLQIKTKYVQHLWSASFFR